MGTLGTINPQGVITARTLLKNYKRSENFQTKPGHSSQIQKSSACITGGTRGTHWTSRESPLLESDMVNEWEINGYSWTIYSLILAHTGHSMSALTSGNWMSRGSFPSYYFRPPNLTLPRRIKWMIFCKGAGWLVVITPFVLAQINMYLYERSFIDSSLSARLFYLMLSCMCNLGQSLIVLHIYSCSSLDGSWCPNFL